MLNTKPYSCRAFTALSRYVRLAVAISLVTLSFKVSAQAPVISYVTPQTFTVNTPITPLTPTNTGGAVPATIYGQVSTFAGEGNNYNYQDGTGINARFGNLWGIAKDIAGNLYVSDNIRIRKITMAGVVTTLAGGNPDKSSDGIGTAAGFNDAGGLVVAPSGDIYMCDFYNYSVRKITQSGIVTTFAGAGLTDFNPTGITIDQSGNFSVAEEAGDILRKITNSGTMSIYAGNLGQPGSLNGNTTSATFFDPMDLKFDSFGNLYVVDDGNNMIRKIDPSGNVTIFAGSTLSGTADGVGTAARFNQPTGIAIDAANNLYIADSHSYTIRMITPQGSVTTIAGNYATQTAVDGIGKSAGFGYVGGLVIGSNGNLFVTDRACIRMIVLSGYTIDKPLPAGLTFDPTTGIISGTPTAPSPPTNYTITAYNTSGSSSAVVNIAVNSAVSTIPPPPNISYQTPQTYAVNTPITALAPTNTGGAVPATIYGQVTTFAGSGVAGFANGQGTAASFNNPTRLGQDASGNLYVADRDNGLIRKITPSGLVSTFSGGFNQPNDAAVDAAGNVYVANAGNNEIQQVSPSGLVTTLFAGTGATGATNGPGTGASFYHPYSLAIDLNGNIYVADSGNNLIREITPTGVVSTFAGDGNPSFADGLGTAASFNGPSSVATDAAGNIYVADPFNNRIRKITPAGQVTTIAGNGLAATTNGPAATASFNTPAGVCVDGIGNVYVADILGNTIRKIDASGNVTTLAGSSSAGAVNGTGILASFNHPNDVQSNPGGFLYVTDYGNSLIRKIIVTGYAIDKPLPAGLTFDATTGIISGTPTAASPATNYTITAYNVGGSSATVVNIAVVAAVTLKPSIITFPSIPTSNNIVMDPGATSTNNETPIVYTSSNSAVAIITANEMLQVTGPGTTTITATQTGDANYSPATPVSVTFIVVENQFLNFPAIAPKTTCDADFSVTAISYNPVLPASTLPITYSSSNTSVATISAQGLIHILSAGVTNITAGQAGNTLFAAATPISQTLTVTPPAPPIVSITATPNSICPGTVVTFSASTTNASANHNLTYQWMLNGVMSGNTANTFSAPIASSADFVKCTVTDNTLCQASGSNSYTGIVVNPYISPSVSIVSSAVSPVCSGSSITFTATPTNGGQNPTYQWKVNNINAGTNNSKFTSSSFSYTDQVTCTITNNDSPCLVNTQATSKPASPNIIPPANPTVSITVSNNGTYPGVAIIFTATMANTAISVSYQWQVNGVNAGTNSPTFTTSSLHNGDEVTCMAILSSGCIPSVASNIISAIIIPAPSVTVVNTFTPNGDGVNDLWVIPDLVSYPNCLVSVYNRYGTQLFQSRGYTEAWDGTYKGHALPVGTYYYVIDLDYKSAKLSGHVTIVR